MFGISGTGTSNYQSRTVSQTYDKREATDSQGEVIGLAFSGLKAEHSIEMLGAGAAALALGAAASAPSGIDAAVAGEVYCVDEVTSNRSNDDFLKSTAKVTEYVIED